MSANAIFHPLGALFRSHLSAFFAVACLFGASASAVTEDEEEAEKTVARSIALAAHTTPEDVLQRYATLGDMGLVAEQLRQEAGTVLGALSVDEVFLGLRAIAQTAGKGAIEQKIARLADLLTQVDGVSAKYVVRILVLATWHIRSKNWSFSKNGYAT